MAVREQLVDTIQQVAHPELVPEEQFEFLTKLGLGAQWVFIRNRRRHQGG